MKVWRRALGVWGDWWRLGFFCLAVWSSGSWLKGQGCAMCKTTVAGQADSLIASLGWGVVILLVPPLIIVTTILYVAFRRGG